MAATVAAASDEEKLALLCAHPDLAGKAAVRTRVHSCWFLLPALVNTLKKILVVSNSAQCWSLPV
jgi:hypothetical protein